MKALFFVVLLLGASSLYAQSSIKLLKNGDQAFEEQRYLDAINDYEKLLRSSGAGIMGVDARLNLAEAYRITNQIEKASRLYAQNIEKVETRYDAYYGYGEVLVGMGLYADAKRWFLKYAAFRPEDPRGIQRAEDCEMIQKIKPFYKQVILQPQRKVNTTKTDEFGLAYYKQGVVLTSDRVQDGDKGSTNAKWTGRSYANMYYAAMDPTGALSQPSFFDNKLNGAARHDGPATFTRDYKTIVFTRTSKNVAEGRLSLELLIAYAEGDGWTKPERLPFVKDGFMYAYPSFSRDGKTLYFMSDQDGGYGKTDIWQSVYENGEWQAPTNLGQTVNTEENEAFPYMHPSGQLFFASKGHLGYGGYDIFQTQMVDGIWRFPRNMGKPINSSRDDTNILLADEQTEGFFSSAREGTDDVYRFTIVDAEPVALPEMKDEEMARFAGSNPAVEPISSGTGSEETSPVATETETPPATEPNDTESIAENTDTQTSETPEPPQEGASTEPSDVEPSMVGIEEPSDNQPGIDGGVEALPTEEPDGEELVDPSSLENTDQIDYQLSIHLQAVDVATGDTLVFVELILTNATTGKKRTFNTGLEGVVEIPLEVGQEYLLRGIKEDYYGTRLPVSTVGVAQDQAVELKLPLEPM